MKWVIIGDSQWSCVCGVVVGLWGCGGCGVVAVYRHVDGNGVGEKEGDKRENVLAKRGKPVKRGVYIVD